MNPVYLVNGWATAWSGLMIRALVDTAALLALMVAIWLPLRRRVSAQLAHGVFCLVLLRLVVPISVPWDWWQPLKKARHAVERVAAWARPSEPLHEARVPALVPVVPPSVVLPATGDVGASVADASKEYPLVVATPAASPARKSAETTREASAGGGLKRASLSMQAWLMLGWAACAAVLLARFCLALFATRRMIRAAVPLDPELLPIDVEALRQAVGLRGQVRWAVNFDLNSPAVGGLVRPTVILPPDLGESLTPKQMKWVLLHELAHVRRGDLWVVVVQRTLQALFFFNPAVHLANWIIDELREYACDDAALAACQTSRRVCGEGFLAIVERSVERAPVGVAALGLFESRLLIRRRLIRILDDRRTVHARLSPKGVCGLFALALIVLAFGRPRGVSADLSRDVRPPREPVVTPAEPVSFRPGAVWRADKPQNERGTGAGAIAPRGRAVVLALAYSPDGSTLASAGDDAVVLLRDVASGGVLGRLQGHTDAVSCLAFSPDGKTLATGSYDQTVRLWDVPSRRARATLAGHTNWVFSVAFSPDGKVLASAGHDKMVRVWDVLTGGETAALAGHLASVRAVAFAPGSGSSLLVSAGADRLILLWNLKDRLPRGRLEGHKGTVRALAFSPDRATLAAGSEDGDVTLWDMRTFRRRASFAGHSDIVTCLAFSPSGAILATGSLDTTVKLWDLNTDRERASLQGHTDGVSALAFASSGQQMATGGFDGVVRLWEPTSPIFSPAACHKYPGEPRGLAYAPDGRTLRAAGGGGTVSWDVATGLTRAPAGKDLATAIAQAPDGAIYATGGPDGMVHLIDSATGRELGVVKGHDGAVASVAFSPDGRVLASGGHDGKVCLWDAATRRPVGTFSTQPLPVSCVAFSPDGRTISAATCGEREESPGHVVLWDVATGRQRGVLRGHERAVASVAFSPDGRLIATAGSDGIVRLWESGSLTTRSTLKYGPCQSVAFSPDGRYLASAHQLGDVVLWDAVAARQIGLLKGHVGLVRAVVFSPDGASVATAGTDETVKLWRLATRRQTARATLRGEYTPIWSLVYSPDGKTLAVADGPADAPGTVTLWDPATRKVKATLDGHQRGVAAVSFSPDGTLVASGGCEGAIRIWDVRTGEPIHEMTGLSGVTELVFSPDGALLASAGEGKVLTLWDVATGSEVSQLTGFRWPVLTVAFSPDGTLLATGGGTVNPHPVEEGEVKVWDVRDRSVLFTLDGHKRCVTAVAFSPDGARLATGGVDETIRVWDIQSRRQQLCLGGLSSWVAALSFSRDGRMLAWSGRGDGLVSLHDTTTGAEVVRLVGHGAQVRGIAFAPDGRALATGGADRTIKLWDVPSSDSSLRFSAQR
jgi:WD40 repeat protein/beta-lactamase regulating signal transducer with metallopeptidase domain